METARSWYMVLGGLLTGLWIASLFHWMSVLEGFVFAFVALCLGGIGAMAGSVYASDLAPTGEPERRDTIIGWAVVGALVAAVPLGVIAGVWS